jgi:uncharacterized protein (TIGR00156 family)
MTKRRLLLAIGLLAAAVFAANAQQGGFTGPGTAPAAANAPQGGYKGPSVGPMSVADAKTLRDDSPVILRGKIERYLGNEKYVFADATGKITVEIENKVWGALSVNEKDAVEISGEVDRDFSGVEIEVKSVRKL